MSKKKQEYKLWDKAKHSLEKHYGYICSNPHSTIKKLRDGFINIGSGGIITDVVGIKDIGNRYEPRIEIIAVEVKENLPNYRERHMDQAKRASVFAHKVFLAVPREFKPEEVELAVKERIGLFELNTETRKLKLIVPSPTFEPSDGKVVQLMRRLEFFKCSVCGCYWNENLVNITRYSPTHVFSKKIKSKFFMFICEKCSAKLYDFHFTSLKTEFVEEWKFKRSNKKIEKINLKTKKFAEKEEVLKIKDKLSRQDEKIESTKGRLRKLFNKKLKKLNKQFSKLK